MVCPQCKCQYLEGITICIDCHIPLVEYLQEEPSPSDRSTIPEKDLITFQRFPKQHEAEVAKGLLESNGIPAIVSWDDWGRIGIQKFDKKGYGIRLMIKEEDLKLAQEVFRDTGVYLEEQPYAEMSERSNVPQSESRNRLLSRILLVIFIFILLTTLLNLFR
jgi:hypothetical protein